MKTKGAAVGNGTRRRVQLITGSEKGLQSGGKNSEEERLYVGVCAEGDVHGEGEMYNCIRLGRWDITSKDTETFPSCVIPRARVVNRIKLYVSETLGVGHGAASTKLLTFSKTKQI